jgi:large conductance mechanosensitive channel
MKFLNEFRAFALKGNVFDMAIGVIVGGAFAKLSGSFVNDVMMPPIASISGQAKSMADKFVALDGKSYESAAKAMEVGAPIIKYGAFINTAIDFLLMTFAVFVLVKIVSKLQQQPPPPPPPPPIPAEPTATEKLLIEIRDALKVQRAR